MFKYLSIFLQTFSVLYKPYDCDEHLEIVVSSQRILGRYFYLRM